MKSAVRRYPLLAADLLALHNRCCRLRHESHTLLSLLLMVIVGALLIASIVVGARNELTSGVLWMQAHGPWVAAAAALHAAVQVARRRRVVERQRALSWLIAVVGVTPAGSSALLWRSLWPLGCQFALIAAALQAARAGTWSLLAWMAGGVVTGAIAGWRLGGVQAANAKRYEASRYTARTSRMDKPSLQALSSLPIVHALAWHRPENTRMLLLMLTLLLPAGTSAQTGACVLLAGLLMSYAAALVRAVLEAGSKAALWLHATPLRFAPFAWSIVRRAVIHQAVSSLLIAALFVPLGAAAPAVLYFALLWLVLVAMLWTVWLRGCFETRRALLAATLSVTAALGMEQLARGTGLVSALLWTAWNVRARAS